VRIIQRNGQPASNSAQSPGCVESCAKPKPRRITRKRTNEPKPFYPDARATPAHNSAQAYGLR
jgi:hypothetical protein